MTIADIIERLEHDRYSLEPDDNSPEYRRGWNDHASHTLRWLRVELGLRELVSNAPREVER